MNTQQRSLCTHTCDKRLVRQCRASACEPMVDQYKSKETPVRKKWDLHMCTNICPKRIARRWPIQVKRNLCTNEKRPMYVEKRPTYVYTYMSKKTCPAIDQYSPFPRRWNSKCSSKGKSKSSIVKVQVSFQMSHGKGDLWWPSRISISISTTISRLIFWGTGGTSRKHNLCMNEKRPKYQYFLKRDVHTYEKRLTCEYKHMSKKTCPAVDQYKSKETYVCMKRNIGMGGLRSVGSIKL